MAIKTNTPPAIRPVSIISFLEEPDTKYIIEWETFSNREEAKPTVKQFRRIEKTELADCVDED